MAALAADSRSLRNTLQLAFCHLLFNIIGILIFYPVPFMRFPIPMAKLLGRTTAKYRWFSIFYLLMMFFFLPMFVFALSSAGKWALVGIGVPIMAILTFAIVINVIQAKNPSLLPIKLQDWNWLPLWIHSLDPVDNLILKATESCSCLACCVQAESRHDSGAMGIRANPSQLHILDPGSKSRSVSEDQLMTTFDNSGFINININNSNGNGPHQGYHHSPHGHHSIHGHHSPHGHHSVHGHPSPTASSPVSHFESKAESTHL